MKHKSYLNNLVVINDDNKDRLFRIDDSGGKKQLIVVDFLPTAQKFIKIYPLHNLIITPEKLYTLQGVIIKEGNFDSAEIICFARTMLICSKLSECNYDVSIWNGEEMIQNHSVSNVVYNDKYIAMYNTAKWKFFDSEGNLLQTFYKDVPSVRISGNTVIFDEVGNHSAYSINTGACLMSKQMIIKAGSSSDFVVGVDLSRRATIYHKGTTSYLENVSFVDLVDEAQLLYVRYDITSNYVVYEYHDLKLFAADVSVISYDEEQHVLLITSPSGFFEYRVSVDYDRESNTKKYRYISIN